MKLILGAIVAGGLSAIASLPAAAQSNPAFQIIGNLDMAAVPDLSPESIRKVQSALRTKQLDPGPSDGVPGPRTKQAIQDFQTRYGMKPTGAIDNQLLFALGQVDVAVGAAR